MISIQLKKVFSILARTMLAFFFFGGAASVHAQGGPPIITDDPGTPGNKMWEVNFLGTFVGGRAGRFLEAPNLDLNYGLGDHVQLKFEVPWLVGKVANERTKGGLGNSTIGVKWRFLDEDRHGIAVSTYPQFEFKNPTRSVARGVADGETGLFLPIEAVKKIGPIDVNFEIGYLILPHETDELEYGLAFGRQISKRIELLAELHGSALRTLKGGELLFNAGSRVTLGNNSALLFSAGRSVRTAGDTDAQYVAAFGIQFTFSNGALTHWRR